MNKLSWKTKVGYGLCSTAESIPYNLFYIFFLFFLTDVVGISAVTAGIISGTAALWDSVIDPPVGVLCDHTAKKSRLTWMKVCVLPLGLTIFLTFAPFEFGNAVVGFIYYTILAMLVWTFYSAFVAPYYALGSEITKDYNERNKLWFFMNIVGYILFAFVSSGPMWIWDIATNAGYNDRQAWGFTGTVFAVLICVLCAVGIRLLRNKESYSRKTVAPQKRDEEKRAKLNYYKTWKSCFKVKSFRKVVAWILVYEIGFVMLNAVIVYMMTHNIGMDAAQQSVFWLVSTVVVVTSLPWLTFFGNKYGKKSVMLATSIPAAVASILFFVSRPDSALPMYIYAGVWGVSSAAFYLFYITFAYDCIEIDEFISGVRKSGSITALAVFFDDIGAALGLYGAGLVLGLSGYDSSAYEQSGRALQSIITAGALFPGIFVTISILILMTYRVSKRKYELLRIATMKKKAGEEYSAEGFEDIL